MKTFSLAVITGLFFAFFGVGVVQAGSSLELTGSIWNPNAAVKIADRLQVTKRATFKNAVRFYGNLFNPNGYVTVDDDFLVTGAMDMRGTLSDSVDILTLDDDTTITGDVTVDSNLEVKGEIYNSNAAVTVNDDLSVTGDFSVNTMATPTSATCETSGTMSYDVNFLYICVSNTWKKVSLLAL